MRFHSPLLATLLLWHVTAFPGHVTSGLAQGVQTKHAAPTESNESGLTIANISFEQTRFDHVREGYQSLKWNDVPAVGRYQLRNADGVTFYDGIQAEAFVSGLPDGQHSFVVHAFSVDDVLIGVSETPAVIVVNHWSMTQAWTCFGIGALVSGAIIGCIVAGTKRVSRSGKPTEVKS